ncbi:MAG: hypothetical protein CVV27_17120 [Candidatus Melainabacteria bacterium HGW-Melainabacteria-1]|nr:MAG: hypothetical protein CVV27_17120 [Candidatus Melainabacteria bacterium HGW-Melainabacteria-1]
MSLNVNQSSPLIEQRFDPRPSFQAVFLPGNVEVVPLSNGARQKLGETDLGNMVASWKDTISGGYQVR